MQSLGHAAPSALVCAGIFPLKKGMRGHTLCVLRCSVSVAGLAAEIASSMKGIRLARLSTLPF